MGFVPLEARNPDARTVPLEARSRMISILLEAWNIKITVAAPIGDALVAAVLASALAVVSFANLSSAPWIFVNMLCNFCLLHHGSGLSTSTSTSWSSSCGPL